MSRSFVDLGHDTRYSWWGDRLRWSCQGYTTDGAGCHPCTTARPCATCRAHAAHLAKIREESPFTRLLSPR